MCEHCWGPIDREQASPCRSCRSAWHHVGGIISMFLRLPEYPKDIEFILWNMPHKQKLNELNKKWAECVWVYWLLSVAMRQPSNLCNQQLKYGFLNKLRNFSNATAVQKFICLAGITRLKIRPKMRYRKLKIKKIANYAKWPDWPGWPDRPDWEVYLGFVNYWKPCDCKVQWALHISWNPWTWGILVVRCIDTLERILGDISAGLSEILETWKGEIY